MGKRGNVAAGSKRTKGTGVAISSSYMAPPDYLSPLAKDYWEKVLSSFPEGYFNLSDSILLEQFCEAAAQHRVYIQEDPTNPDIHRCRNDVANLGLKLRITKNSQISEIVAKRASDNATMATVAKKQFNDLLYNGPNVVQ